VDRRRLLAELSELLKAHLKLPDELSEIQADEPLFGGRLRLDSVDAAQWVLTVERHFGVRFPDSELMGGNLKSLGTLADVLIRSGIAADRTHRPS